MGSAGVHPIATAFDSTATAYERGRPGYPDDAVAFLSERLGAAAGATIVDLAAGTGKLTRSLRTSGAYLIAIEPLRAMRAELGRVLPSVAAVGAVAERLPLARGTIDGVVVANAWHWFDSSAALGEVHRVLRPRGKLLIVYNRRDESVPWVARLSAIIDAYRGDAPQYRSGRWRDAFDTTGLFDPFERRDFRWAQPLTPALLHDRVASISFIAHLGPGDRAKVMRSVDELVADELGGRTEFSMPHTTEVYATAAVD
jgi:SAM-dependent methyltransferase